MTERLLGAYMLNENKFRGTVTLLGGLALAYMGALSPQPVDAHPLDHESRGNWLRR